MNIEMKKVMSAVELGAEAIMIFPAMEIPSLSAVN